MQGSYEGGRRAVQAYDPYERPSRKAARKVAGPVTVTAPSGLSWTVHPAPKAAATLGAHKPRAEVVVEDGGHERRLFLASAVAKRLVREKDFNGHVSTFDDLLREVDALAASAAAERLLRLVDKRDYSEKEARDKLANDGYRPEVVDDVVARAVEGRLIDDMRFADAFVRGKVSAGWGERRIEQELVRRGVEPSAVPGWPSDYFDGQGELERAWEIVARRSVPAKNPYEKTVRFLVGRGFSYGVAKECAARVVAQGEEE